jgi:hypothetical protein
MGKKEKKEKKKKNKSRKDESEKKRKKKDIKSKKLQKKDKKKKKKSISDQSINYNVRNAIVEIRKMKTSEEIAAFISEDKRISVLKYAAPKLKSKSDIDKVN